MQPEAPTVGLKCVNCGQLLTGNYCSNCGQSVRSSRRLTIRDTLAKGAEAVLDVDAVLPATFIGLWVDPGKLVGDYVEGKRKRFLNPFTYLLIAITAQIVMAKILNLVGWRSSDAPNESIPEDAITWVLLLAVIPLALTWTLAFKSSGRNLAENYVLGLFVTAQFLWIETLFLLFPSNTFFDIIQLVAFSVAWLGIMTWAGVRFYSMHWISVFWRMCVGNLAVFVTVVAVVVGIMATLESLGLWQVEP